MGYLEMVSERKGGLVGAPKEMQPCSFTLGAKVHRSNVCLRDTVR